MTPYGRDEGPRPFSPAELDGVDLASPDELVALSRIARELEAAAERGGVRPSADFANRVMRSIAAEPSPAPVRAASEAVRRRSASAVLGAIRDAVRVAFGAGFPIAVRAQALALVLAVTVVVATGSSVVTVGAVRLLGGNPMPGFPDSTSQPVTPIAPATPHGSIDPSGPDGSPEPSEPGEPSASDYPNPSGPEDPSETAEATDASGGNGGNGRPTGDPGASASPEPTESDHAEQDSPHPSASPSPVQSPSAGSSGDPLPFPSSSPAN